MTAVLHGGPRNGDRYVLSYFGAKVLIPVHRTPGEEAHDLVYLLDKPSGFREHGFRFWGRHYGWRTPEDIGA